MDIKLMAQEELAALLAKTGQMNVEQQVRLYLKLRNGKAAIKKHLEAVEDQFKQVMSTLENHMLATADKEHVGGFTIPGVGTTYTAETKKISIADDNAFFAYVLASKDLDFFERRVSVTHVTETMELNGGMAPPGLNIFRERVMRVRKAGEKATS